MSLFLLSEKYEEMRKTRKEYFYRALKAEEELEDLRMTLHQFAACTGEAKETARSALKAEAIEYAKRLTEHPFQ